MDHPALSQTVQTGAGGVMVWGVISLAQFSTNWASLITPQSTWVLFADHVHLFMTTVYHLLMYFQQDNAPCHKAQIISDWFSWTWQWVHFTQMTSTVTRSQSNRAPLGCGGTRDSHHGCADDKSTATVWCYHVNMDQHLWGMFPTPCWIYDTKN